MAAPRQTFSLPSIGFLRWLIDPGSDLPEEVRGLLLSRLLSNPVTIMVGMMNSLLVSTVALSLQCGPIFIAYIIADVLICPYRASIIRAAKRGQPGGAKPAINTYLITGILWCAIQGAVGLTALGSGRPTLELLSTMNLFGMIGPICARNYPVPRYCMLLIMALELPYVAGCVLFGKTWLLIVLLETPPVLLATFEVVRTFQRLAIETLMAAMESRHRATHDPLTGLLNRRGFQEAITHHIALNTSCLGVLALDLDGFKAVNDIHGHHVGDGLLEAVARRLLVRARPVDLVIRLGGDEFVLVLNNVAFAEASRIADRVIEDIGQTPFEIGDAPLVRVGVSIGIACSPEDGADIERLHRLADLALYEAKLAGRGAWRRSPPATEQLVASD